MTWIVIVQSMHCGCRSPTIWSKSSSTCVWWSEGLPTFVPIFTAGTNGCKSFGKDQSYPPLVAWMDTSAQTNLQPPRSTARSGLWVSCNLELQKMKYLCVERCRKPTFQKRFCASCQVLPALLTAPFAGCDNKFSTNSNGLMAVSFPG